MDRSRPFAVLAGLLAVLPLAAQALCTSDGVAQPAAVLERFVNADCAACWRDPATPKAPPGTFAIDWVVPGSKGENAPLSAAAHEDALERIYFLHHKAPDQANALTTERNGDGVPVRVAQGEAFNDYIGTSIELKDPGREAWRPWLLLVERLPAGAEGSPVPRNVVRNVFRPDWGRPAARAPGRAAEARPMQIREGAKPDRLRLVAVLHDGRGRIRGITHTECRE
jgi:hypothetical protein